MVMRVVQRVEGSGRCEWDRKGLGRGGSGGRESRGQRASRLGSFGAEGRIATGSSNNDSSSGNGNGNGNSNGSGNGSSGRLVFGQAGGEGDAELQRRARERLLGGALLKPSFPCDVNDLWNWGESWGFLFHQACMEDRRQRRLRMTSVQNGLLGSNKTKVSNARFLIKTNTDIQRPLDL